MPSRQAAPAAPGLAALFTAVSKGGVAGERCAKQLWNTVECGLDGGVDDQLLECASRLLIQSGVRFELTSPQRCCLPSAPGPNSPPPPPPPRRRRCPSSAAAASWAPWPSTCRPAARPAPPSWRRWCSTWPPGCRRRTKWFASGRASCWPTSCSPCTRMPSCHRCARAGRGWAGSPGLSPAAAQDAAGAAGGQGSRAATCHRPTPLPPPPHPPRQTLLDEVADQLIGRLEDKVTGVRAQAARALGRLCAPDEDGAYSQDPAAAALMGLLEDEAVKASSGSPGRGGAHEPAGSRSGQGKQW